MRIGILLGFTGPIESLTPDMAASAELAFAEAGASGLFLGGRSIEAVRGDSTCTDAAAAVAAAERLVTSDGVAAILGADCSGVTNAVAQNVAVPRGIVSLSPAATSPALSDIADRGLFFRVAPSDARQGEVLAEVTLKRGVDTVAVTYTNNDYGKGLADSFTSAFAALGGSVAATVPHEDGRADYSAEVATLSASGADHLLVIGYIDQGGRQIVQASLDLGAFDNFIFPDGMIGDSLMAAFGADLAGSFGTVPGSDSDAAARFEEMAHEAGITGTGPYRAESYDGAALIALAIQAAGSDARDAIAGRILDVANAPGVKIGVGEIGEGLRILSEGGEIDYVGATDVELSATGDAAGSFRELDVRNAQFTTVSIW